MLEISELRVLIKRVNFQLFALEIALLHWSCLHPRLTSGHKFSLCLPVLRARLSPSVCLLLVRPADWAVGHLY